MRAAGLPAVVTNETFLRALWADMLVANDAAWWLTRAQEALQFEGIKLCLQDVAFGRVMTLEGEEKAAARAGGNSGYTAVWATAQACASRILLNGFDFRGDHWHGAHKAPLRNTAPETFQRWAKRFDLLAADLRARGIEVLNCTPGSALSCFPFADLKEVLHERERETI